MSKQNLHLISSAAEEQIVANIADSHVDFRSRWSETLKIDAFILEELARIRPSLITHSGDVTNRESGIPERRHLTRQFTSLAEIAPVIVTKGNHDEFGDLEFLASLRTKYPIVVEQHAGIHRYGGFAVATVAWMSTANLIARLPAGTGKDDGDLLAVDAMRHLLIDLGNQLHECPEPKLLLMHAMVRNSLIGQEQPLCGVPLEVGPEDLALVRPDFGMLGHIHLRQCIPYGGVDYVYPGSTRRTNYGEQEVKGLVIATFQEGRYVGYRFLDLPATQMILVESRFEPTPTGGVFVFKGGVPRSHLDQLVVGADVRLRYTVEREFRDAAKRAAHQLREEWTTAGAINVKPDEKLAETTTARLSEITTVRGLRKKLEMLWKHRGNTPEQPRAERLLGYAETLEAETKATAETNFRGAVRWNGVRAQGIGEFDNEISIDFSPYDGKLIVLTGTNGSGKSTFAEFLPLGMLRQGPTRGTLASLATRPDSFLEIDVTSGRRLVLHHKVNALTGGTNAAVMDEFRKPVYRDTTIPKFTKWAKANLPPKALFFTGPFASQKSTRQDREAQSLVELKAAGRKTLLLRALGIESYKAMTALAAARAKAAKETLTLTRARLEDEKRRGGDVAEAEADLQCKRDSVREADAQLTAARESLAVLLKEIEVATESQRQQQLNEERRLSLEKQLAAATLSVEDLRTRIANNQSVIDQTKAITTAVNRDAELEIEIPLQQAAEQAANSALVKAESLHQQLTSSLAAAEQRVRAATAGVKRSTMDKDLRNSIESAVASLASSELELKRDQATLAEMEAAVAQLRSTRLTSMEDRVLSLKGGLTEIAEGAPDPVTIAGATLGADDTAVTESQKASEALRLAEAALEPARLTLNSLRDSVVASRLLAARKSEIDVADKERVNAEAELRAGNASVQSITIETAAALVDVNSLREVYEKATAARVALETEREGLGALLKLAPKLTKAQGRLDELTLQLNQDLPQLDSYITALLPLRPPAPAVIVPSRQSADDLITACNTAAQAAVAAVAVAETQLKLALASRGHVELLQNEIAAADELYADWIRVAEDIGPSGLQALEISAAEPELNELVNDLLERCAGGRFSVSFETTRLSSDGKEEIEDCPIIVRDSEKGREAPIETYCGGERVILDEAISLAFTMLSCRHSGAEGSTLVRDETGAALAPEFGPVYVAMLRRAAEITQAANVIFITHTRELQQLADVQIHFEQGCVSVLHPEAEQYAEALAAA